MKTITIGVLRSPESFGPWDLGNPSGGGESLFTIHTGELVSNDIRGGLEGRIAASLPSTDEGTIVVLPDGRMQTTWRVRPNVKWHDGAPFTAQDILFSWQLIRHPQTPGRPSTQVASIEAIDVPEPLTAVITWRTTFFDAVRLTHRELALLPRHLLSEPFDADKDSFQVLPYWTTAYVHTGPFRLVDFGLGETQVYERFDDYFLGRPKVDRVIIKVIPNENTLLANLLASSIDMAAERAMPAHLFGNLADDWQRSGEGVVVSRQENWRYLMIQFNPEWGAPPELSRDARVRRGLYYGLDRDAIRAFAHPGFTDTEGDSFLARNDPRSDIVGQPFARYRHDPSRALQELAEAGWRRASDGRLLSSSGQQVQIELRGTVIDREMASVVAQQWRDLGVDMKEQLIAPGLIEDREWRAKFPAFEFRSANPIPDSLALFDSRLAPTPQNRYFGLGAISYNNAEMDRLLDRLFASPDWRDQGAVMKQIGEILAAELPSFSLYFRVQQAAVRKGVRALVDDYAGAAQSRGALARNAHLWERE